MASGLITEYLGQGAIADRPATPDIPAGAIALWYSTDTNELSRYAEGAWAAVGSGGVSDLDDLADVDAPTPADGDVLTFDSGSGDWVPAAPSSVTAWKDVVRCASTAAITLASGAENGDAIDGVTLATGNRILLKDQAAPAENGIYTVNSSGAPTRATDADSGAEMVGALVPVSEGTVNADRVFQCTTNGPITLGTTGLTFREPRPREGTAFPSSPSDGERFFRTDRNIDYFYQASGTRWLSTQLYTQSIANNERVVGFTATGAWAKAANPWATTYSIYVEHAVFGYFIFGTGNWTMTVSPQGNGSGFNSGAFSVSGAWTAIKVAVGSVFTSALVLWESSVTENSGTGTLYGDVVIAYRLVG